MVVGSGYGRMPGLGKGSLSLMHGSLSTRITVSHSMDIKRNEDYQVLNRGRSLMAQFDTLRARGNAHFEGAWSMRPDTQTGAFCTSFKTRNSS